MFLTEACGFAGFGGQPDLAPAVAGLAWVTLEEVALDAVAEDGRLVARTSARQVAERLGVDPGTAQGIAVLPRPRAPPLEPEQGPTAASACRSTCSARSVG